MSINRLWILGRGETFEMLTLSNSGLLRIQFVWLNPRVLIVREEQFFMEEKDFHLFEYEY